MKKNIFVMMILLSSLTIATGQPGYEEYRYIKGNSVGNEERMSRINVMEDRHITGQAGYTEYKNIKGINGETKDEMTKGYATGQPGYTEYRYTQGDTSKVIMKD